MPNIDQMYAFVVEEAPGDEGIPAICKDGNWYPMVGADWKRVESLRPYAESTARKTGKTVKLLRFTCREEVETITVGRPSIP